MTDAELIRYLDGEITMAARASVDALLRERTDIAARLEQLRRRSGRLSALLGDTAPSAADVHHSVTRMRPHVLRSAAHPPLRRWQPNGIKAAAAIFLLFGFVLAVPDARAWVFARARDVGAAIGIVSPEPNGAATTPQQSAPAAATVSFTIDRDTIEVVAPAAGVLVVRPGAEAQASAEASDTDTRFTVLPAGLRIEAPATVRGSYTLTLPAHVRVIRLVHGSGRITHHGAPPSRDELRIELQPQ